MPGRLSGSWGLLKAGLRAMSPAGPRRWALGGRSGQSCGAASQGQGQEDGAGGGRAAEREREGAAQGQAGRGHGPGGPQGNSCWAMGFSRGSPGARFGREGGERPPGGAAR